METEKRGAWRKKKQGGRKRRRKVIGGWAKTAHRKSEKEEKETDEAHTFSTIEFFSARSPTDFWECKVTRH